MVYSGPMMDRRRFLWLLASLVATGLTRVPNSNDAAVLLEWETVHGQKRQRYL